MMPHDAAEEIRAKSTSLSTHRLAELFSVIDGALWSPEDETGLRARLADYMRVNGVTPASR